MNRWAALLAECSATLQRLIARANRVSLPRTGCTSAERLQRLRDSLIHQRTVRETYFLQEPAVQDAIQQLRTTPRGLPSHEVTRRYGPIRPLRAIAASITPQSISEQLLLLGWLLPRPAQNRNTPPHICQTCSRPVV
jgi:hypothetical protein